MKLENLKYYTFLGCIVYFSSCVTFKQFDSRAKAAKETSYEAAIINKNGAIITGKSLKHKNHDPYDPYLVRVTNSNSAFTIDGKKFNDSNIIIFQDDHAFHKRFNDAYLIRLAKGKINLYYFDNTGYDKTYTFKSQSPTSVSKVNTRKTTFFFEKDTNTIIPIGIADLKNAVKDNPQVLAKLNSYYPNDSYIKELNIEKLLSVIEMYNQ